MISRRSSDRTARTDSSQRRPGIRRGIKKRGILPSFGDLVLPIVSVAAVGLLVLAGRQFFLNGIKTPPGISSTRAYAESPALIAERERKQEEDSIVKVPVAGEKDSNPALDAIVKQEVKEVKQQEKLNADSKPAVTSPAKETPKNKLVNVSQPAPKAQPAKAQPKAQPARSQASSQKKPEPKKAETKKQEPKKAEPQKKASSSTPSSKQWRVQIGAYTSKSGAQEAVKKLKKAGYNAVVYSNPASKHHKVWVAGGNDKQSAQRVVNSMKKLGYGSSFAFPPSK